MMNYRFLAAGALALTLAACADEDEPTPPAMAYLRVAHLSPDAPAVDFCIQASGSTTWTGPVMESLGVTGGLAFKQVTAYLHLDAVKYNVRLVAPTDTNCNTGLVPDITSLPALPANAYVTAAAVGLLGGTPTFTGTAYIDESTVAAGQAKLRFVHAAPNVPEVNVGLTGTTFTPIFTNVVFPGISAAAGLVNGYVQTAPLTGVTIGVRLASAPTVDALTFSNVSLPANAIATAFAVGLLGETGNQAIGALLCVDNAPASGGLSACTFVPPDAT